MAGRNASRGFTLLEVLIAVLVLSIGLLGSAALTLGAQRAKDGATMRTQAELLANSILDNMRANRAGVTAGNYTTAIGGTATATNCAETTCTNAQIAASDLYFWKVRLGAVATTPATPNQLPCGDGSIVTAVNGNLTMAIITVQWSDARAEGVAVSTNCTLGGPDIVTLTLQTAL